jgi:serine/threonine protein kinase
MGDVICLRHRVGDLIGGKYTLIDLMTKTKLSYLMNATDEGGQRVVVKIILKPDPSFNEITTLRSIGECKGLVKLLDFFTCQLTGYEYAVFPLYGKSLQEYCREVRSFTLKEIKLITIQLAETLKIIHERGYVHADLKTANILLKCREDEDETREIVLIDMGLSICNTSEIIVGTYQYTPPEVLSQRTWSYPADSWSLGCVLYELYLGRKVFSVKGYDFSTSLGRSSWVDRLNSLTFTQDGSEPSLFNEARDPIFRDLISRLIAYYECQRLTMEEVINHPFIFKYP